jgi:predicted ester cyclase
MRTLAAIAVLLLVAACQAPPAETPDHREANRQTARDLYAALDAQDFDRLDALTAPDLLVNVVGTQEGFPWSAVASEMIPMYYGAFEGYRHVIDQLVAEDDWVVARLTYHGTHTGEFMGAPATGTQMTYGGVHMLRVVDGVVTEFWFLEDDLGLMRQLGMDLAPVEEG